MKLSVKQENFCNFYLESGNASEAYRRAYSCLKMKPETINSKACQFLKKDKIRARVEELQSELKKKTAITKERVLEELGKIGFSTIAHLHNTWIERKEFENITDDQKACIKSISTKVMKRNIGTNDSPNIVDVEMVKIELYDKVRALEVINKMMGFERPGEMKSELRIIVGD